MNIDTSKFIELEPEFLAKNYKIQKFKIKKSGRISCNVFMQDIYIGTFFTGKSSEVLSQNNGRTKYFFIRNVQPNVVGTICLSFDDSNWRVKYITLTDAPKQLFHSLKVLTEKCIKKKFQYS